MLRPTLCDWTVMCDLARGCILSKTVSRTKHLINHLADIAPNHFARIWAYHQLSPIVEQRCLEVLANDLHLGPPMNSEQLEQELFVEILLNNNYIDQRHLGALQIAKNWNYNGAQYLIEGIRQTIGSFDLVNTIYAINSNIPLLFPNGIAAYSVTQLLLHRICCWPLFINRNAAQGTQGFSIPVGISICSFDCDNYEHDHKRRSSPSIRGISKTDLPDNSAIVVSLRRADRAARDTWAAKHGRVEYCFEIAESTIFEFDFTLASEGVKKLENPKSSELKSLHSTFLTMLRGEVPRLADADPTKYGQSSLEAYMAQACVARMLNRWATNRTTVTGGLFRSEKIDDKTWELGWFASEKPEQLLISMQQKALHAGSCGLYNRFVIPFHSQTVENLQLRRRSGLFGTMPQFIGATNLSRVIDLTLPGSWRPERFVRSEHLALISDRLG